MEEADLRKADRQLVWRSMFAKLVVDGFRVDAAPPSPAEAGSNAG